ncbi:MAG: transcription antitermination factor NusB [Candidatus Aminicenantes bacterium]|nr:transcription antitermination factor NusB [Candidatus Aminicenantes bacterium]
MGLRRKAREAALQLLYQVEFEDGQGEDGRRGYWSQRRAEEALREYADLLFRSVLERREEIDALLRSVSRNWRLERMPVVDRNILRLATVELLLKETDPAVVIDEAVEIARAYSSAESTAFVNGILDALCRQLGTAPAGGGERTHEPKKRPAGARKGSRAGGRKKTD